MLPNVQFPVEIVLKPEYKRQLPHSMAGAGHIYLVEQIQPGLNFMRICANPNGDGEHTTVNTDALNLRASMACW